MAISAKKYTFKLTFENKPSRYNKTGRSCFITQDVNHEYHFSHPVAELGYHFIEAKHLPKGKDEYYFGLPNRAIRSNTANSRIRKLTRS